jgi:hypothetical protein
MNYTKVNLAKIFEALEGIDGYVMLEYEGREYVITSLEALNNEEIDPEKQLALPDVPETVSQVDTADEMLEKINRDIAMFQLQQDEENLEMNEFNLNENRTEEENNDEEDMNEIRPPRRVRFEPLRGDLSPDLQG